MTVPIHLLNTNNTGYFFVGPPRTNDNSGRYQYPIGFFAPDSHVFDM